MFQVTFWLIVPFRIVDACVSIVNMVANIAMVIRVKRKTLETLMRLKISLADGDLRF